MNSELNPPKAELFLSHEGHEYSRIFLLSHADLANLTKGQVAAPCWAAEAECFLYCTQTTQKNAEKRLLHSRCLRDVA